MYDQDKNLLAQLHKLAARQDENFLTEAFAHLLRHLRDNEPQAAVDILRRLTGTLEGNRLKIEAECIREKLTITTQVTTEKGRPDIEIAIEGQFRAFVEAKSQSNVREGQLKRYRKDLTNSGLPKNALALVLLTRYPAEIPAGDEEPDVFCRWFQIADWLEDWLTDWEKTAITNTESYFLTRQFVEFLKIRNIAMEKAGPELAAGMKSLRNILRMLEEAINAKADSAKFSDDRDHIGFYVDDKQFFVGIDYEEPTLLGFQTWEFPVGKDAMQRVDFGKVEADGEGGLIWAHNLELGSTFFALDRRGQMDRLEDFVGECLDATKKIKKINGR